ncbi:cation transport regulator ChaB [Candidatus Woesearchaeota archaeon]|nr:cation transport regulator ChaB [Candidatus Woesearchaeota archaeon]
MPYRSNKTLPKRVRDNLPQGAQTVFRKAYNNAYEQYKDPKKRKGNDTRTEAANKVAWSAVKKKYKKKGDKWVKK